MKTTSNHVANDLSPISDEELTAIDGGSCWPRPYNGTIDQILWGIPGSLLLC